MSDAAVATGVVDALVVPSFAHQDDLREYMRQPYAGRGFSGAERWFYPPPKSELRPGAVASDPDTLCRHVLDEGGADFAVLVPLTRGLMPDVDVGSEVCSATNRWLAERWLEGHAKADRLRGTIRVNPEDPAHAIREIEQWAEHPGMVQVGVTLQAKAPYGQRRFRPIWQAAAERGLPIVVKIDRADGIQFPPTSLGYPTHFIEFASQYSLAFTHHLLSLICEGVFEDLRDVVFVFGDGGLDLAAPIMLRADKDWRPSRPEVPWVEQFPSRYLDDHVRFVMSGFEGPSDAASEARWLQLSHAPGLGLHASHYPYLGAADLGRLSALEHADLERIAGGNARRLYQLP